MEIFLDMGVCQSGHNPQVETLWSGESKEGKGETPIFLNHHGYVRLLKNILILCKWMLCLLVCAGLVPSEPLELEL